MTGSGQWTVRLSASAETDLQEIVAWTETNLGAIQAARYAETLSVTIATLFEGPACAGSAQAPGTWHGNSLAACCALRQERTAPVAVPSVAQCGSCH